jgi:acyl phosphate:glycerol-3-phosphate acyltransferase
VSKLYTLVGTMAYFLGSIPVGLVLMRVFRGIDIRQTGSGNIGAANVARSAPGLGLVTLILDSAKGYVAVLLGMRLAVMWGAEPPITHVVMGLAALSSVVGHAFPLWLGFKGGKGVATGFGAFLAIMPKPTLAVLALYILVLTAFRYASLASIAATAAFPIVAMLMMGGEGKMLLPFVCAAALIIVAKHHENIRRLLAGTENHFQLKQR